MERHRTAEMLLSASVLSLGIVTLGYLATGAFSSATKDRIRKKYNFRCAETGVTNDLECHHEVPQCMGGSDTEANGALLSTIPHKRWDAITQETGLVYPGVPIDKCPPEMFRSEEARQIIVDKYERGLPLVDHIAKAISKAKRRHHEKMMRSKGKCRKKYRGQGRH